METTEILRTEHNNTGTIHLYKEGIFWRAYENSAMLFCENIKKYIIQKKFVKKINSEILYLGFPDSVLLMVISLAKEKNFEIATQEKFITIKGSFLIPDFQQKRSETPVNPDSNSYRYKNKVRCTERHTKLAEVPVEVDGDNLSRIYCGIKNFPVLLRTPLQCQQFIVELQNEINDSV